MKKKKKHISILASLLRTDALFGDVNAIRGVIPPSEHVRISERSSERDKYPRRGRRLAPNSAVRNLSSSALDVNTVPARLHDAATKRTMTTMKRTLVVYSGPTSLDRTKKKNDIYLTNFDYFLRHGVECGRSVNETTSGWKEEGVEDGSRVNIHYAIVLTREVADRYTAIDGLITKRQLECDNNVKHNKVNPVISVLIRKEQCYDMESMLVVLRSIDVVNLYDYLVYVNCGLAGPKVGPRSPMPPSLAEGSSWTERYTALLSDKIQMVGHSINSHFSTVHSPHIQSFLFAVNADPVLNIWLDSGTIYECGLSNSDLQNTAILRTLIWRYEVGMSRILLQRGYSIASVAMHRGGPLGEPLIIDQKSTFGQNPTWFEMRFSTTDIFYEWGIRQLTDASYPSLSPVSSSVVGQEFGRYDILPWEYYIFFKVSRLIPSDIQSIMNYQHLGWDVYIVPNDAMKSHNPIWRIRAWMSSEWWWRRRRRRNHSVINWIIMGSGILVLLRGCFRGIEAFVAAVRWRLSSLQRLSVSSRHPHEN